MPDLIKAYNFYNNDFDSTAYFILCYNQVPSNLLFETSLKDNKENMDLVISSFDFEKLQLHVLYKIWTTADEKDSDSAEDYPYKYFLQSKIKNLLIFISLDNNWLRIEFDYDVTDLNLEQEVISMNEIVRKKFGTNKSPTFKVLTFKSEYFSTENVKNEFLQANINELYNDDFQEINGIIEKSLNQEKSGLILLHGTPGTGKTSYVKSLISKFQKHNFIFIQNEFVKDLLKPDFIAFLLRHRNSILIIEDAEKVVVTRESLSQNSVVSTILQLTDGIFSDYLNIKIICTFNTNIEKVDKALLRKGRLIANYEFKPLSAEKSKILLTSLGHESNNTDMTLADIFNFEEKAFDSNGNTKKIGFR